MRLVYDAVPFIVFGGGGFLVGFAVGRWWVLVFALIPASWATATVTSLEVPSLWFGLVFGAMAAVGLLLGVGARRLVSHAPR